MNESHVHETSTEIVVVDNFSCGADAVRLRLPGTFADVCEPWPGHTYVERYSD